MLNFWIPLTKKSVLDVWPSCTLVHALAKQKKTLCLWHFSNFFNTCHSKNCTLEPGRGFNICMLIHAAQEFHLRQLGTKRTHVRLITQLSAHHHPTNTVAAFSVYNPLDNNGKHALSSSTPGLKIRGVKVKSYVERRSHRSWIVLKNIVYVVRGAVKNTEKLKRNKV